MNVRLESVCHGDGKVFLQLIIDRLMPEAFIALQVFLKDGTEIPAHLFPFRPLDEHSEANFVVVLPHFDVREVDLDFSEIGLGDKLIGHTRLTAEINLIKWKTRINALVRTELTQRMLDIEREYCADRMNIYFTEAIDEGAEVIVKMLVDMPQDPDCDVRVDFLDDEAQSCNLPVYPLIDEVVPASELGDFDRLQVGFSVRVPRDRIEFTAHAYDANGIIAGGFARFCDETYEPLAALFAQATLDASQDPLYEQWYHYHCATLASLALQRQTVLPYEPKISLVIPLYGFDRVHAHACLHALELQTYSNFEVVLVDACSEEQSYDALLDEWAHDERFVHIAADPLMQEATAALTGLMQSTGEYKALLFPSVVLAPEALFEFVRHINECLEPDDAQQKKETTSKYSELKTQSYKRPGLLFSNHDTQTISGDLTSPVLKPVYSPDLLSSYNYLGPFVLVDEKVINQVAAELGFVDEAFLYDLILKVSEHAGVVERVDRVLYHVQDIPLESECDHENLIARKQTDFRGGRRVVANHLRRLGVDAVVVSDSLYERYQIKYRLPSDVPRLAVIIPNRDQADLLEACVASVLGQKGLPKDSLEVIVIENGSTDPKTQEVYRALTERSTQVRIEVFSGTYTFSAMANYAAKRTDAEYLLFLDNDTEFISDDGLVQLLAHAKRADIGIVGAKLVFSDDTIQHAGMAIGPFDAAGNLGVNLPGSYPGYMKRMVCASNVSAVTSSCQMVDRAVFQEVGGYDERFQVGYYDVDFCLKVLGAGYHIACNPDVMLYHYENATQGHLLTREQRLRLERERAYLHYRWPQWFVDGDPYLSACLDQTSLYFQLSSQ